MEEENQKNSRRRERSDDDDDSDEDENNENNNNTVKNVVTPPNNAVLDTLMMNAGKKTKVAGGENKKDAVKTKTKEKDNKKKEKEAKKAKKEKGGGDKNNKNKKEKAETETETQISRRIGETIKKSLHFEKWTVRVDFMKSISIPFSFFESKVVECAHSIEPKNFTRDSEVVVARFAKFSEFHDLVGNKSKLSAGSMYGSCQCKDGVFIYHPKKETADLYVTVS